MNRTPGWGTVALLCVLLAGTAQAQGNLPQPVQAAMADLARRSGVPVDEIAVVTLEEVTWPDASLGNPQPGMFYAQVLTPGYRVIFEAAGQRYEYHTDRGTRFTLLEPADTPAEPAAGEHAELLARLDMIRAAKTDLARRLGIGVGAVYLASVERETWPDASLGFPQPGAQYDPEPAPGYRLIFETPDARLTPYHTDMSGRVVAMDGAEVGAAAAPAPGEGGLDVVEAAVQDLANRLGVNPEDVSVVSVEDVQWMDGSLGLPEPGMVYTKAIEPGHRIVLEAAGRYFEYHSRREGTPRYAGVVYPDDPRVTVLHLTRVEPTDGNNFFDLMRTNMDGARQRVLPLISDFAATPDGREIAIVRRESRSSHTLGVVVGDGEIAELDHAFSYGTVAWDEAGAWLAYWRRSVVGAPAELHVRARWWPESQAVDLPDYPAGSFRPGALAWTNEGLAITIYPDDGPPLSFFWDRRTAAPLADGEVLCWIPRTRALVVRNEDGDIVTVIPGVGETARLASGADIASVAAPATWGTRLLAVRSSGPVSIDLVALTWWGQVTQLASMTGASTAEVRVSPVGGIATVHYLKGDEQHTDVLRVGETAQQILTISEPGPAVPVAD